MDPMKRLGLAVMLVVGVGLLGSTTARADTFELMNVGDEPLAIGHVTYGALKLVKLSPDIPPPVPTFWEQKMTISCRNLTPGATYWTTAGTFTADRNGNGKVSGWVGVDPSWRWASVERLNADGSWTVVLAYWP